MFEHIIGNEQAKEYLRRTVEKGTVGNSLLFAGPDGIGKSLFADAFAKMLICRDDPHGLHRRKIEAGNHPDIHVYRPEGKIGMHSIASLRQFNEEVYLAPFESKWKVFIIHEADRMLTYSANALLKTFEEPAHDTIIILISSSPAALLPTVFSRCRSVYFHPLSEEEVSAYLIQHQGKSSEEAKRIAAMSQGSIGHSLRLIQEGTNPLRALILDMLAGGGVSSYKQLSAAAASIAEHLEDAKKKIELDMRAVLQGTREDLSAAQKQSLEKEVEGAVAMQTSQEALALFGVILAWYRDLQLIYVNGSREMLIHRDYANASADAFERGETLSLEVVQKAIGEARLSLERSTSLNICFENLFLKLNLLK